MQPGGPASRVSPTGEPLGRDLARETEDKIERSRAGTTRPSRVEVLQPMAEPTPRTTPEPGLLSREQALVAELQRFLTSFAERSTEAAEHAAAAQARAERDRAQAIETAQAELDRRLKRADTELAEARQRTEAQHTERLAAVQSAWDSQSASDRERNDARVERIERRRREAVWLAETVLESSRPKPQQEHTAILKRVQAGLKTVGEWEVFIDSLWPNVAMRKDVSPSEDTTAEPATDDPEQFEELISRVGDAAKTVDRAVLPKIFRGGLHLVLIPAAAAAATVGVGLATDWNNWKLAAAAGLGGLLLAVLLAVPLRLRAARKFRHDLREWQALAGSAYASAEAVQARSEIERDDAIEKLVTQCKVELDRANDEARQASEQLESEWQLHLNAATAKHEADLAEIELAGAAARAEIDRRITEYRDSAHATHAAAVSEAEQTARDTLAATEKATRDLTAELDHEWQTQIRSSAAEAESIAQTAALASPEWNARLNGAWQPPTPGRTAARVGRVTFDLASLLTDLSLDARNHLPLPDALDLPVVLDMVERPSLLVEAAAGQRNAGLTLLQTVLLRLLASIPPGRAKLTIIDPVGRGRSFAGLMRLADHDESLVGSRIWTESRHIEQRLTELTEHIENVIQKYLRDDYATIDEYNRVAGEIAEPYRYLVIADFPANFSEDAVARLASVIDAGPRCGVFVVMLSDLAAKQPAGFDLNALRARAVVLQPGDTSNAQSLNPQFRLEDQPLSDLAFTPDPPPSETETVTLLDLIGTEAQSAGRVEVRYSVVEPPEDCRWTRSAADELRIPIGRAGATKAQELRLGKGTSQHVLIAGKTGSGKSTLLHVLTTAAMLWHDPSEVEFYLVDFKKGVEFKPYASGKLPHVRAVAIESDREFGLSVLQRLDTELRRRGDLFRDRGLQSLAQFRQRFPDQPMPRSILIIDEFQEFFVEDDRIAQDASLLLDRLVRQGRAFGIHILLASQTLSGAYTLSRSTVGQMAVRIAMKCSETDSYLILSEDNGAARLLTRPGEAIYNDANGLVEGNNPFQVAWLGDDARDEVLRRVEHMAEARSITFEEPVFFEGNAPAELDRNRALRRALTEHQRPVAPIAWLGEPVSIKDPTGATMRRRGGANLLIVGQRTETAAAMLAASVISLAAQHDAEGNRAASFRVVDATPEDDPLAGRVAAALEPLPHDVRAVSWRDAPDAVEQCYTEMLAREDANRTDGPAIYLVLHGLHWLRSLRRKDDDFSFSMDADTKGPAPDQQLKQLLIDGPRLGVFVLAWCDTTTSLVRALDRASIAEFGNRVLMQMSANDSSMLIESTSAGRLGLHRAIFYDEERGAEEKFRPFGMPTPALVRHLLPAET